MLRWLGIQEDAGSEMKKLLDARFVYVSKRGNIIGRLHNLRVGSGQSDIYYPRGEYFITQSVIYNNTEASCSASCEDNCSFARYAETRVDSDRVAERVQSTGLIDATTYWTKDPALPQNLDVSDVYDALDKSNGVSATPLFRHYDSKRTPLCTLTTLLKTDNKATREDVTHKLRKCGELDHFHMHYNSMGSLKLDATYPETRA